MSDKNVVEQIAEAVGGTITGAGSLPDGSGFCTMSFPLPKGHWIYAEGFNVPPMPFRMGTESIKVLHRDRDGWAEAIKRAAKYAVRASTMNGKEMDFDPDAMVQNMVVGMIGYWSANGLSNDAWANPDPLPPHIGPHHMAPKP